MFKATSKEGCSYRSHFTDKKPERHKRKKKSQEQSSTVATLCGRENRIPKQYVWKPSQQIYSPLLVFWMRMSPKGPSIWAQSPVRDTAWKIQPSCMTFHRITLFSDSGLCFLFRIKNVIAQCHAPAAIPATDCHSPSLQSTLNPLEPYAKINLLVLELLWARVLYHSNRKAADMPLI